MRDLLADGALGQVQLLRRAGEAQVPGGGFEALQGGGGGHQAFGHGRRVPSKKRKKFIPYRNHVLRKGRLLTSPYRLILTGINNYNRHCEEEASAQPATSKQEKRARHLQEFCSNFSAVRAAADPFEGSPWLR